MISDIARALGVSTTTVSFVLNGKAKEKRISTAVTKRVLDYVEEVGYKPNELAKSLRTGKTKIIGLIIEDISNPFFSNIARLIEAKAYSRGYRIIYCSTENDLRKTIDFIDLFRDRHVDGYIITPPEGVEGPLKSLMDHAAPVVLLDRYLPGLESDYVIIDNREGALAATNHLLGQGFRRIGFVTTHSRQTQMSDRLAGYSQALTSAGQPLFVHRLQPHKEDRRAAVEDFYTFFTKENLDAVLFAANHLAVIGLEAFKAFDLPVPGVVSYDDHIHFRLSSPTITVVSQPIVRIAEEVIEILFNRLEGGKKGSPREVVLRSQLIVRESSLRRSPRGGPAQTS